MAKVEKIDFITPVSGAMTSDQIALQRAKEIERKLSKKLVSVRLDERTVVTTTKNRIKELVKQHNAPVNLSR